MCRLLITETLDYGKHIYSMYSGQQKISNAVVNASGANINTKRGITSY